jgi:hypothetical protein
LRSVADAIGRAKLALAPASAARLETPFRNFSNNPATVFDAPEPLREPTDTAGKRNDEDDACDAFTGFLTGAAVPAAVLVVGGDINARSRL